MTSKVAKILKILCYVLSFPLFLLCAIIAGSHVAKQGGSYGLGSYAGIIVAVLFTIVWAVIVLFFELKIKKVADIGTKKKIIKKQTTKLVITSFALLSGLMLLLDFVLPPVLPGPTANTIFYEDLADDANGRADVNKKLLDIFIERNVMNGMIGGDPYSRYKVDEAGNSVLMTVEELSAYDANYINKIKAYQKKGMKSSEVEALLARDGAYCQFKSFNLAGYESFIGPWLDMANDQRMTIPAIVYLIIGQRDVVVSDTTPGNIKRDENGLKVTQPIVKNDDGTYSGLHEFWVFDKATKTIVSKPVKWTILDMMGDVNMDGDINTINGTKKPALEVDLRGLINGMDIGAELTDAGLNSFLIDIGGDMIAQVAGGLLYGVIESVLSDVPDIIANDMIAGAPLYVKLVDNNGKTDYYLDEATGEMVSRDYFSKDAVSLGLYAGNADRGVLDYQSQAWVDSNGLIFIICSILSIREVCFIFTGVCVLLAVLGGLFREKELCADGCNCDCDNENTDDAVEDENEDELVDEVVEDTQE
ncbi:MAG: hypothetical protein RSB20_02250 [Clostridia bacterium]